MERDEYIAKWQEWWDNLPQKDFKLILENHVELKSSGWWQEWFGWDKVMTDKINSKLVREIKNKSEIKNWNWKFDAWVYPFYCYTVVSNPIKYFYAV